MKGNSAMLRARLMAWLILPLVARAVAADAAQDDLAALRHEVLERLGVLVVDGEFPSRRRNLQDALLAETATTHIGVEDRVAQVLVLVQQVVAVVATAAADGVFARCAVARDGSSPSFFSAFSGSSLLGSPVFSGSELLVGELVAVLFAARTHRRAFAEVDEAEDLLTRLFLLGLGRRLEGARA